MPLDEFDDRGAPHQCDLNTRRRGRAAAALQALLGDVAYFWWAFAGLGAVMWVAAVC